MPATADQKAILALVRRTWQASSETAMRMRIRRLLINQSNALLDSNGLGTTLPAPFNKTSLAIRSMIGEPSKAAQHYASRIAANRPDIEVVPLTTKKDISQTVARKAGEQERLDAQMWEENGGREAQWKMGWAMSVTACGYYLTLPRDASFGLPDRTYYQDKTDDDVATMIRDGKIAASKVTDHKTGQLVYAEKGDVWAARRKDKMRAQAGTSLFTLEAFPRDMVLREKDIDGIKWAAVIEEVSGTALAPGSDLATSAARQANASDSGRIPEDDIGLYGLFKDEKGAIIGGISRGGPLDSRWNRDGVFTLIRYFDREEQVVFVAAQGSIEGGREVYRGKHGCTINGYPACPVEEVPFMVTDVDVPGLEFTTSLQQVFGYIPQINQLLTLMSNASAFNGIPRWVVELDGGTTLRDADGEPKEVSQADVPGLSPNEASAWPGTLKQLLIDTKSLEAMLGIYFNRLDAAMPPNVAQGDAGGSGDTAWGTHQLIQQAQQNLVQPVDNHAKAVKRVIQRWHGWLRDLDVPVYFFAAPGHRKDRKTLRGLIEFDPSDLTDSIQVTQDLDTPSEATVRIQIGMELWGKGAITDEVFYSDYVRSEDARQSVIDRYVQLIKNYVILGQLPPGYVPTPGSPPPMITVVADGIRGAIHYELLQTSANYADANARQQAQAAQAAQQPAVPPASITTAAGMQVPGAGLAPTLQGQLGSNVPGGMAPASMAGIGGGA